MPSQTVTTVKFLNEMPGLQYVRHMHVLLGKNISVSLLYHVFPSLSLSEFYGGRQVYWNAFKQKSNLNLVSHVCM